MTDTSPPEAVAVRVQHSAITALIVAAVAIQIFAPARTDNMVFVNLCGAKMGFRYLVPVVTAAGLSFVAAMQTARRKSLRLDSIKIAALPLLWILPLLLSVWMNNDSVSENQSGLVMAMFGYWVLPSLMSGVAVVAHGRIRRRQFEDAYLAFALLLSIMAVLSALNLLMITGVSMDMSVLRGGPAETYRYLTTMGGPITSAFVFQTAAIMAMARRLTLPAGTPAWLRGWFDALVGWFTAMTALGASRGNMIALMVGVTHTVLNSPLKSRKKVMVLLLAAMVSVASLSGVLSSTGKGSAAFLRDALSISRRQDSNLVRLSSLSVALSAIARNPVCGVGPATVWPRDYVQELRIIDNRLAAREPHSAWALIASEGGVVALVGFVLGCILMYRQITADALAYRGIMISTAVFSMVSSDIFITAKVGFLFFMLIGVGMAGAPESAVIRRVSQSDRRREHERLVHSIRLTYDSRL